MALMLQPLVKYADFEGRARRSEYWLFSLFLWIVLLVLMVAIGSAAQSDPHGPTVTSLVGVLMLCWAAVIIPSLAVTVRRLHDIDKSGWWFLISFIPIVGAIVILIFSVTDGTRGPNRFGPDPKERTPYTVAPTITEVHHYHHGAPPQPPLTS